MWRRRGWGGGRDEVLNCIDELGRAVLAGPLYQNIALEWAQRVRNIRIQGN